jgi:hypothetical protein
MELKMTLKEADRYLKRASRELNLSYRQTLRIWHRYNKEGSKGLVSKKKGQPSNHQFRSGIKETIFSLIQKKYLDYGPTLVKEKLEEKYNIKIGKETLRQLMIKKGIWVMKKRRNKKVYARRTRRSRFGELEQIDGSHHAWFEDREKKCCLLVSVDDATSTLTGLKFCETENTQDYLDFLKNYIKDHGRPLAFYSDKHSTFRVNNNKKYSKELSTQFHRVLKALEIELICANSPQAKGRVERANRILQDRLVKELREQNICSIEEGNRYLKKFIKKYNRKFGTDPAIPEDVHRDLLPSQNLEKLCMLQKERILAKDLSFQYKKEIYQIDSHYINRLSGKKVQIYEMHGEIKMVLHNGKSLSYRKWREKVAEPTKIMDTKTLARYWPTLPKKPKKYHPWR